MGTPNQYYRPYLASDSDLSDADSEASWSRPSTPEPPANATEPLSTDKLVGPDYALLAKGLNVPVLQTSGPTFPKEKVEDAYGENKLDTNKQYSTFDINAKDASGVKIKMEMKDISTVVVLQSRDRDKKIFLQPTNCTLNLPRVYKNIIGFSVAQINLTSAFFYFRQDKQNLTVQIYEKGRVRYPVILQPTLDPSGTELKITTTIRPGSYNIQQLLDELNTQLNLTPLFYDFLNGFSDFYNLFSINGDYSVNFNYPGDNYYDALQKVFIKNPTKAQIVSYYFQSQFANQLTYTDAQIQVAYYYPVLKEALLDPTTNLSLYNLEYTDPVTGTPFYTEETIQYLIYQFTGLNDPVAQIVIANNIPQLNTYRLEHTFRYYLANRYVCSYNQTNNRVTIQTTTLATSLTNLLNNQYNIYLTQAAAQYGLSIAQYNALLVNATNILSILQSMYDYLQIRLARFFAVSYNTYSRSYYANPSNSLLIRYGIDASGVRYSYVPGITPRDVDFLEDFRNNPPYYWNKLKNLGITEGAQRNMGSPTQSFPTSSNFPYVLAQSNIDLTRPFVDVSGNIYTDFRRRAGDVLVNVDPTKYTIFQFRSKVRQTLQVETLPRQTLYRYPLWNKSHIVPAPISNLFDISYSYITPDSNLYNKITYDLSYSALYGWSNTSSSTSNFGYTFNQSSNYWGASTDTINANYVKGKFYRFQTPLAQARSGPTDSNVYTYDFNVTIESDSGFQGDLFAFFYHDIAAFSADISGSRLENPINYKYKLVLSNGTLSNTYSFLAYAQQQYYILLRPDSSTPSSTALRIIPWFPNGTTFNTLSYSTNFNPLADPTTLLSNFNVAKNNDPAFLRLPVTSNLWSNTSPSNDFVNNIVYSSAPAIGYDASGVSTDLTDYMPFSANNFVSNINPVAVLRADPTNNFLFQFNSPYSSNAQTYFYTGSQNTIYNSGLTTTYIPKSVLFRQYKIVQWYATNYIHDTSINHSYTSNDISPYCAPYTIQTTSNTPIPGYLYQGTNNQLTLGRGVCGYTFLPSDGTWQIQRLTFKTNFITTNPSINGNEDIQALAVFITAEILADPIFTLNPGSNALAICLKQSSTTYTTSNLNVGFDAGLGSYYTFSNDLNLVTRSNVQLSGYSQSGKQLLADSNSYYSVIAFNGLNTTDLSNINSTNSNVRNLAYSNLRTQLANGTAKTTNIHNITGTPIAYPYANQAYPSTTFYDGQQAPTGQSVVLSTSNPTPGIFGPPPGADESMSKYEQSIPIVNSHIHYLNSSNIVEDISGFNIWKNVPLSPNYLNASVPNYMLFQDGQFTIAPYKIFTTVAPGESAARSFSNTEFINLTIDQIYPAVENTTLLAVSGNNQSYVFLGSSNNYLRFKVYTPSTGVLYELPQVASYTLQASNTLVHDFVFNNSNGWFLSGYDMSANELILIGDPIYDSLTPMISYTYPSYTDSQLYMDPSGLNVYFIKLANSNDGFTDFSLFSLDPFDSQYIGSTPNGYIINLSNSTPTLPTNYKSMAVTTNAGIEEVLLLNTDEFANNFFKINQYTSDTLTSSNTTISKSVQEFKDSNDSLVTPQQLFGGANGSKWALFSDSPYVMGNRNDAYDSPVNINMAWQIFFPTIKIEMKKLTNGSSPIIDLNNIQYPEWPHTMMFGYSNYTSLLNDISGGGKWGLESKSNFYVSDISFNGFYFNSYLMNFPLYPNYNCNTSETDYYLAVRGYLPTEKLQTMLRFYMPNRYDFGFVRLQDLSSEVVLASNSPILFNPNYLTTLIGFNSNFTFSNQNFGSNSLQGFTGSNYTSSNFGNFLAIYRGLYNQFQSNSAIINAIQSNVNSNINNFIQTDLKYILPSTALSRQRYTDPLLFQILWKSALTQNYVGLDDEWGLGWNLGYAKKDTGFSTIHTGDSFYKIQQDFIYLRLNQEFNINRIDAGGKENYQETRESTGTTNQYYCKLLLTNFGGNSTTFIHNPITFNPPLNRLTKLTFQWLYPNGTIIDNGDAEWNATVNIQERTEVPAIPDKMVFQPADPKTGKPAPLPAGFQEGKAPPETVQKKK